MVMGLDETLELHAYGALSQQATGFCPMPCAAWSKGNAT
nr:hypothetical protein SHINE37_42848 [Rhizobiaceae bacterium]